MAFSASGTGLKSEINVTPLVDVVLVLRSLHGGDPILQMGYRSKHAAREQDQLRRPPTADSSSAHGRDGRTYLNKDEGRWRSFGRGSSR